MPKTLKNLGEKETFEEKENFYLSGSPYDMGFVGLSSNVDRDPKSHQYLTPRALLKWVLLLKCT